MPGSTGATGPAGPAGATGPAGPPGTGGGSSVLVSDTAPTGVPDNTLWFESDTGLTYILYNDGNSTQWVPITLGVQGPPGPPSTVIIAGGLW